MVCMILVPYWSPSSTARQESLASYHTSIATRSTAPSIERRRDRFKGLFGHSVGEARRVMVGE